MMITYLSPTYKPPIYKQPSYCPSISLALYQADRVHTAILLILDYLTHHLDNGYSIDVIYLDFQKAFDTVPHQRLLQMLTSFGIHGNVLKRIESFLSNRRQ